MIINVHRYRFLIILIFILLLALTIYIWRLDVDGYEDSLQIELEKNILCGEYLEWEEVNKLFPKKAYTDLIDLETGMRFRVQRRGGTYHADVQPLTAEDTATMKAVYNGEWTWKRRAVIVQLDSGQKIAASMNGMPHGLGNIVGNDFNGHFCLHFKGSKTHCSSKVDTAHQLMIWKSAGRVEEELKLLEPRQAIEVLLAALDQGEINISGQLMDFDKNNSLLLLNLANIKKIGPYRIDSIKEDAFSVDLRVIFKDEDKEYSKKLNISTVKRDSGWKVSPKSLSSLLDRNNLSESGEAEHSVFEEDLEMEVFAD